MDRRRFPILLCALAAFAAYPLPSRLHAQAPDIAAPRLHYTTTWIGNSFPGTVAPGLRNHKHVQISADALFVAPDGTCYLNSAWDEDGYEAGIYRNGDVVGNCDDLHGWGRSGGKAICASDRYLYVAMSQRGDDGGNYPAKNQYGKFQYPPKDRIWRCVRRYDLTGKPAPFAGGSGHDGSMLIVAEKPLSNPEMFDAPPTEVTGLACSVAMNRLYMCSRRYDQQPTVTEYDAETLQPVEARPHLAHLNDTITQIAVGERGDLWALISRRAGESIYNFLQHFGADGQPLGKSEGIDLPADGAISLDEAHHRLFFVDDTAHGGSDQRVSAYDIADGVPRLTNEVGAEGGILAGKGSEIGRDGHLRFNRPMGAGCDRAGNLYVACSGSVDGGGVVLESYGPNKSGGANWTRRIWRLIGLEFVDGGDFDPATDGQDVYTKEEHFRLDLSKPTGPIFTYIGYTVRPAGREPAFDRLPTNPVRERAGLDPRTFTHPTTAFLRRIGGAPILYTTDMYIGPLTIDRFAPATSGECGIPCGFIAKKPSVGNGFEFNQTSGGEWIWRDTNGDSHLDTDETTSDPKPCPEGWGWCVDSRGDIWQTTDRDGIRHFPCGGLDAHGSPIYTFKTMEAVAMPAPMTELCRAEYVPETDTMFLTGYTTDHPHTGGEWGAVGTEVLRFDKWKAGNRTPNLRIPLLYDGQKQPKLFIKSFSVAGDYCFAAEGRDPERIFVYDTRSGKLQGVLQPDATVGSNSGWIDHPYAIRAFRRKNGEYLVLAEEDLDAKLILYRWTPPR